MTLRDRIERILREDLELEGDDRGGLWWRGRSGPTNERAGDLADLATDLAAALEKDMPTLAVYTAEGVQHYLGIDFWTGPPTVTDVPAIREGRE